MRKCHILYIIYLFYVLTSDLLTISLQWMDAEYNEILDMSLYLKLAYIHIVQKLNIYIEILLQRNLYENVVDIFCIRKYLNLVYVFCFCYYNFTDVIITYISFKMNQKNKYHTGSFHNMPLNINFHFLLHLYSRYIIYIISESKVIFES